MTGRIHPQPVPISVTTSQARTDEGTQLVVVQIDSATGAAVYFVTGEDARRIGAQLVQAGDEAKAGGLTIARAVPPERNGDGR